MSISRKHRFIFIKTSKMAGTSIEVFLSQHCGPDDVLTPIIPHVAPHRSQHYRGLWNPSREGFENRRKRLLGTIKDLVRAKRFFNHIPALLASQRMPVSVWGSCYKFCLERNPWEKSLSHFHMVNSRAGGGMTFDQYLERGKYCLNFDRYTDCDGNLIVDRVIRYESMLDELGEVFQRLGIPFDGTLGVRAKSDLRGDRRPYQEVYTDAQREEIERVFVDEITMHGDTF